MNNKTQKFTFVYNCNYPSQDPQGISAWVETEDLQEVIEMFNQFLRGCGFHCGKVGVLDDEQETKEVEEDGEEFAKLKEAMANTRAGMERPYSDKPLHFREEAQIPREVDPYTYSRVLGQEHK